MDCYCLLHALQSSRVDLLAHIAPRAEDGGWRREAAGREGAAIGSLCSSLLCCWKSLLQRKKPRLAPFVFDLLLCRRLAACCARCAAPAVHASSPARLSEACFPSEHCAMAAILITGGTGYFGQFCVEFFAASGCQVRCFGAAGCRSPQRHAPIAQSRGRHRRLTHPRRSATRTGLAAPSGTVARSYPSRCEDAGSGGLMDALNAPAAATACRRRRRLPL